MVNFALQRVRSTPIAGRCWPSLEARPAAHPCRCSHENDLS